MKGLLLKDWYMVRKYCRSYLLIAVVFFAVSLAGSSNLFFLFYPCMLCGMIPVNLLGYDERSHWIAYSATLPCSRAQLVSAKYLMGLMAQGAVLLAGGLAYGIKMYRYGALVPAELLAMLLLMLALSMLSSALPLPFMFKLGVERGRAAYYVMLGFVFGASILAGNMLEMRQEAGIGLWLPALLAAVGAGLYALSWYLSVVFFRKREL